MMHYTARHPEGILKPTIDGWTPPAQPAPVPPPPPPKRKRGPYNISKERLAYRRELAERLLKARKATGLNGNRFAALLGVPANCYRKYEDGKCAPTGKYRSAVESYLEEQGL